MLRSINEIIGYGLFAEGKDIGKCKDLLFDDRWWTIRHLVTDTEGWLLGKKVLVSPLMIEVVDWVSKQIILNITQKQLENCPDPEEDETVSRVHEKKLFSYYGYADYWNGNLLWGVASYPEPIANVPVIDSEAHKDPEDYEQNNFLRSFKEVKSYTIKATDGDIGHVEDFIIDDKTWAIRYVVVDTRDWLPGGKKVLLSMNWVEDVSWTERCLSVSLTVEQVRNSPEFDPEKPVNIEYETRLYDYYGRPFEKSITKKLQEMIGNPFF